jgi:hypothetical protein
MKRITNDYRPEGEDAFGPAWVRLDHEPLFAEAVQPG